LLKEFYSFKRKWEKEKVENPDSWVKWYLIFVDPEHICRIFFATSKQHNVQAYLEGDTPARFANFEAGMRARFGPPAAPPEFCKELPVASWMDIQSFEFNLHKLGEWTFAVEDKAASNGRAAKMPGDHHEWAASYTLDRSLLDLTPHPPCSINMALPEGEGATDSPLLGERVRVRGLPEGEGTEPQYRLYAAVRCEAAEGIEGTAMTLGVYDPENRKEITSKTLTVAEISGRAYQWIDLGVLPLQPKQYVWFAPPRRPGEVDAVYIDRIVVVRER
jgi:hypothetical protein